MVLVRAPRLEDSTLRTKLGQIILVVREAAVADVDEGVLSFLDTESAEDTMGIVESRDSRCRCRGQSG